MIQKSLQIQRHCTVLAALLECVSFWLISGYPQWLWQHRCGQGAFPVLKPSQEPTNLCVFTKLFHSFTHSFIFFFSETGIWSCIFLVIGITWSYLFLVWSYKIYLTWLFLYEENKRMFFIKQFLFFFMSVDFHVIDNFISLSDYGNQRKHLTPSNWMQGCS